MRSRAIWMLGLALVLAVTSVLLAQSWLQRDGPPPAVAVPATATVVVAKTKLQYGAILRREHLREVPWPSAVVPNGVFSSTNELINADDQRIVLRTIEVDEPILSNKVTGFGGRASLSAIIAKDMRATTIRVNDVNGVAGFVLPGDRVDIIITRDPFFSQVRNSGNATDLVTQLLLQNVKVLGIDQQADEDREQPSVAKAVTLEVTPIQAQKLILAQQVGRLSLALRNVTNSDQAEMTSVRLRDLGFGEANVPRSSSTVVTEERAPSAADVSRSTRDSSVTIFRALNAKEYDVIREKTVRRSPTTGMPRDLPRRPSPPAPTEDAPTVKQDDDGGLALDGAAPATVVGPFILHRPRSEGPSPEDVSAAKHVGDVEAIGVVGSRDDRVGTVDR